MKLTSIAIMLSVFIAGLLAVANVDAELIPSKDGRTVYDTHLHVNWLADANLAGTPAGQFGVANITNYGSMTYQAALNWVHALNTHSNPDGTLGYLGHTDWQLPTTPHDDPSCSATGPLPYQGSFGFGCRHSDLGALFYVSLGLQRPNTAVPIPNNTVGLFRNFQPYLYWTDTPVPNPTKPKAPPKSHHTFSFNTGWAGSNVDKHFMYALPMIKGNPFGTSVNGSGLQLSSDGQSVYDPPPADVTWLADANLAKTLKFGVAECNNLNFPNCIDRDGSMTHTTALTWIAGMNKSHTYPGCIGYLCQDQKTATPVIWQLPLDPTPPGHPQPCGGFGCTDSPLGQLYYSQLGLSPVVPTPQGTPVVPTPNINVGPFNNVQPYLYWSDCEPPNGKSPCTATQNSLPVPAPNFGWSFSFGNGFQGTDLQANDLYVTVYFPETPGQAADKTPPVTRAAVSGPLGSSGWYVGPTVVNFTATDDLSGVFKTEFSLDNGVKWTNGDSVSLTANEIYTILFRSTDYSGNVETPKSVIVKLDSKPPGTTVSTRLHTVLGSVISLEVDLNAYDNLSGVAFTEYSLDRGSTWTIGKVLYLCGGTRTLLFRSMDVAGNLEKTQSSTLTTPLCGG